ncbi:MAG: hypothetical protein ACN6I5_00960 [Hyphomicrobiales bacterium]
MPNALGGAGVHGARKRVRADRADLLFDDAGAIICAALLPR